MGFAEAELVGIRSVLTAALSESEGTVREAIWNSVLVFHFPVEGSSDAPGPSARGSSDPALGSLYDPFLMLSRSKCYYVLL